MTQHDGRWTTEDGRQHNEGGGRRYAERSKGVDDSLVDDKRDKTASMVGRERERERERGGAADRMAYGLQSLPCFVAFREDQGHPRQPPHRRIFRVVFDRPVAAGSVGEHPESNHSPLCDHLQHPIRLLLRLLFTRWVQERMNEASQALSRCRCKRYGTFPRGAVRDTLQGRIASQQLTSRESYQHQHLLYHYPFQ